MGLTSLETSTVPTKVQYEIRFPPISNTSPQEVFIQEANPKEETLSSLKNKLPKSYLMPPHTMEDGRLWSETIPKDFDTTKPVVRFKAIQVTSGTEELGISINENTSFLDYIHQWRKQLKGTQEKLKITVENNVFQHGDCYLKFGDEFSLAFKRTLRLPDDGREYPLVPDCGTFPIKLVDDYLETVPPSWRKHGGVFIPMFNFEAMFMQFRSPAQRSYSIQVAVGMINALNGNKWKDSLEDGGFMVSHLQRWIDGINSGNSDGRVKQFVAQGLGKGTTVEAQVTGKEVFGGIQIQVAPQKFNKAEVYKNASVFHGNSGLLELLKTPKECNLQSGDVVYILSEDMFGKGEPTLEQLSLCNAKTQLSFQYQKLILFFEITNPLSTRDIVTLIVPKNNIFTVTQLMQMLQQKAPQMFGHTCTLRYKSLVLLPSATLSSYNIPDLSVISLERHSVFQSQPAQPSNTISNFQFASTFGAGSAQQHSTALRKSVAQAAPPPPAPSASPFSNFGFSASLAPTGAATTTSTINNSYDDFDNEAEEEAAMDGLSLETKSSSSSNPFLQQQQRQKKQLFDFSKKEKSSDSREGRSEESRNLHHSNAMEMGIGAGGRMIQKVYTDVNYPPQMFDLELSNRCYVHIVNAEMWSQITGEPCPATPIDPQMYRANGIPWSQIYDSDLEYIQSSNKLNAIQSVQQLSGLNEFSFIRSGDWDTNSSGNNVQQQNVFPQFAKSGVYVMSEGNYSVTLNAEEKESFDRILAMGFAKSSVIEAFVVCEKRESDVVNFLLGG